MKRSQEKGVKSKTKCPPEAAAAEEEDDEDECNICFEDLADTVLWPCMHRLCRTCGTGIATRKKPASPGSSTPAAADIAVLCPFCRQEVQDFIHEEAPEHASPTQANSRANTCRVQAGATSGASFSAADNAFGVANGGFSAANGAYGAYGADAFHSPQHHIDASAFHSPHHHIDPTEQTGCGWLKQIVEVKQAVNLEWNGRPEKTVKIRLSNCSLTDSDIQGLCPQLSSHITSLLRAPSSPSPRGAVAAGIEVLMQSNFCGDAGAEALSCMLASLLESGVAYTRVLKLFRNGIADRGAGAIAMLIAAHRRRASGGSARAETQMIAEVHLSHNAIGDTGAQKLFDAATAAYPYRARSGELVPLWLRLEYNQLSGSRIPQHCGLMRGGAGGGGGGGVRGRSERKCNVGTCAMSPVPALHLPHIQFKGAGGGGAALRSEEADRKSVV